MSTYRDSLGRDFQPLPRLYREVQVLGRPRTRRSLWHIAIQAWAAITFVAVAVVLFAIIGGR